MNLLSQLIFMLLYYTSSLFIFSPYSEVPNKRCGVLINEELENHVNYKKWERGGVEINGFFSRFLGGVLNFVYKGRTMIRRGDNSIFLYINQLYYPNFNNLHLLIFKFLRILLITTKFSGNKFTSFSLLGKIVRKF